MKIAVVGAGVSGLVVAHLLHPAHEVTVFEAAGYAGGHTNTIRVDTADETHEVDTGFIVFNDRNYPNFERLLRRLGVAWQPSTMSFSVSDGIGDFEYGSGSPNALFAKRAHLVTPWFHRMVADLARFNRAARELLDDRAPDALAARVAGAASVLTCVHRAADRAAGLGGVVGGRRGRCGASRLVSWPSSSTITGCCRSAAGRRWRTIRGGSARYVEALTAPFSRPAAAAHPGSGGHPPS